MSRAFRVGLFVLSTLVILAIGVFLIGDKQFLFSSTYRLQSAFHDVQGLNNGAEVRVGGTHQGTVTEVDLPQQPNGNVTVVMKMAAGTRQIIRKDSTASIHTEGLLGNKYVEISFGSQSAAQVQGGDSIRSDSSNDTADLARSTMAEVKVGVESFNENMEALKHNFFLRGFFNNRGYEDSGELTKHAVAKLPTRARMKEFEYDGKSIFDKPDTAKLKNEDHLKDAGTFLEQNKFGLVVIAAAEAMGDSSKAKVLTEARAMVVRDYLVENFKLDDTKIKTIGLGKTGQADNSKVQILIYPAG